MIEGRRIDILQPDVMWIGGLSELLRVAAHADAYDLPLVPHGSGPYSYHFNGSRPNAPFCEYVAASADGRSVLPVFGRLFSGEMLPKDGVIRLSDAPGFELTLANRESLTPAGVS